MKSLILLMAVVLVGCDSTKGTVKSGRDPFFNFGEPLNPNTPYGKAILRQVNPNDPQLRRAASRKKGFVQIDDAIVEETLRVHIPKPRADWTVSDLDQVTILPRYRRKQITANDFRNVTDKGLKDVAKLRNLTALLLGDTKITDAGLKKVAQLKKLTFLGLQRTAITDHGLKEVVKIQTLTSLSLNGTNISDNCLKDIAQLQSLSRLYLKDTKVTKAGVAELQKALPKCKIISTPPTK